MMSAIKMTTPERRATFAISTLISLRMLGLFMVMPVFTLYAQTLPGATPTLIGLSVGIYGLCQACLQMPFGALSDRWGRKPILFFGFCLFIIGSLCCALAHSIVFLLIGRALQGAGAIGSTLLALLADLTRENQRSKAMAIAGMSIGFSFSMAMVVGPLLASWLTVNNLFLFAAIFGFIAMIVLYFRVPTPITLKWHRDTEPEWTAFRKLLVDHQLARLNIGIFILHAIFTATFVVLPIHLAKAIPLPVQQQWFIYLPTLLLGAFISLLGISLAERHQQVKNYFLAGILCLCLAESLLWMVHATWLTVGCGLFLFFAGFSLLEGFLPSLISRVAPASRKGSALGIYSSSQFFGIFIGGLIGGWLYGYFGIHSIYLFCLILALCWFCLALSMQTPRSIVNVIWQLPVTLRTQWVSIADTLSTIPGIVETTYIAEDHMVYLKISRDTINHPDFIRIQTMVTAESPNN